MRIPPFCLECCKWGFKRWGFKQIQGYLKEKGPFPAFSGFPRCSSTCGKRAKKADLGRFPGRVASPGGFPDPPSGKTTRNSCLQFSRPFLLWIKMSLLYLKTCTPVKGTHFLSLDGILKPHSLLPLKVYDYQMSPHYGISSHNSMHSPINKTSHTHRNNPKAFVA